MVNFVNYNLFIYYLFRYYYLFIYFFFLLFFFIIYYYYYFFFFLSFSLPLSLSLYITAVTPSQVICHP